MADIFLSYSSKDRQRAESIVSVFEAQSWKVFWDPQIGTRESYFDRLQTELQSARAVVVLWTENSLQSRWVREEADYAANRGLLYPAQLEEFELPLGFRTIQTANLVGWTSGANHPEMVKLISDLERAIGCRRPTRSIPAPEPNRPLTDDHLALIHTSWRDSLKDAQFGGVPMYQIRVGVFGHPKALDRIARVRYLLDPSYPKAVYDIADRSCYFQLKELANGYSVIRAEVRVNGQQELVRLSRFINLTETGPRLEAIAQFDLDY